MIASLPMYLFPETKAAHDAFWALVRDELGTRGVRAPKYLSHDASPYDVWGADDLVLSHICSLPYRLHFKGEVTPIAASDYGLDGCPPGMYRALFIVRADHPAETITDLNRATMALNSSDSNSGWGDAANWALARDIRFRPTVLTGSHQNSVRAVVAGEADFATIDAQTFRTLQRVDPAAASVRVIGATAPSPGMTFITRKGADPEPFRDTLQTALENLVPRHRDVLGLKGFAVLPEEAYKIPLPPPPEEWQ